MSNTTARLRVLAIAVTVLAVVGAQLATLETYPLPSCDETGYADAAYSLVTVGRPGWSIFPEPDLYRRDVNIVHMGRTYLLGLGLALLAGGRNLWTTRLYSLIGGLLAVVLTYLVGEKLYGRRVGILAALVFLTSFKFFFTAHLGRPETWVTASILASIYLILQALETRPSAKRLIVTGLVLAWTLDFHFNAIAFLSAAAVLALWRWGWQQRQWLSLVWLGLGASIGLILWGAVHAWPDPQIAWQQLTGFSISYTGVSNGNFLTGPLLNSISIFSFLKAAYWDVAWPISLIETSLAALGLGLALYRRAQPDRIWLILIGVSVAAFGFLFSQRFVQYSVLWTPLLLLGGFASLEVLAQHFSRGKATYASAYLLSVTGLIILIQLGGAGWLTYKYSANNFKEMGARLANWVPKGSRVLADMTWWWALGNDRVFMSDEYFIAEAPSTDQSNSVDANGVPGWVTTLMKKLHPDYVVTDGAIACLNRQGPGWQALQLYLSQHCEPVGTLTGFLANDPDSQTTLLGQTSIVYHCSSV